MGGGLFSRPTAAAAAAIGADLKAGRARAQQKERDRIATLSDRDIQRIMARKIRDAATRGVERRDFLQAGIPESRIDSNFEGAMAIARRQDNRLDAIGAMQ